VREIRGEYVHKKYYVIKEMTLIETVLIVCSVVGGLMTTTCWNIRRNRCEKIESPCLSCMRKVMTENELKMDVLNNATMNRTLVAQ